MPCYDSRNEPDNVRAEAALEWRHNSPVAEMLCEAVGILAGEGMLDQLSPQARQWWAEHRKRDRKRR